MARVFIVLLLFTSVARANAPAPWAMCAGKKAGDSCSGLYYPMGLCQARDTGCGDDKPCLYCESRPGYAFGAGAAAALALLTGLVLLVRLVRRRRAMT